jgi:hypothetical protein
MNYGPHLKLSAGTQRQPDQYGLVCHPETEETDDTLDITWGPNSCLGQHQRQQAFVGIGQTCRDHSLLVTAQEVS